MSFTERAAALLVPKPFQEFLPYVSPAALRVIHKDQVLALATSVAARALRAVSDSDILAAQKLLSGRGLNLRVQRDIESNWSRVEKADQKEAGESLLRLYFCLVHESANWSLDLRPSHLGWDSENKVLIWKPSRLRHLPSAEFQSRVMDLYRGFFEENPVASAAGVELYRWNTQPTPGYDERIGQLLREHFGDAKSNCVEFRMSRFKQTFHHIFEEVVASASKLHPELTFLGTTLTGLYLSLEQLEVAFDVRTAYRVATRSNK